MNLTRENVEQAVGDGLKLLGKDSDIQIPAALNDGVFVLKQVLIGIAQGSIVLHSQPPAPPKPEKVEESLEELPEDEDE